MSEPTDNQITAAPVPPVSIQQPKLREVGFLHEQGHHKPIVILEFSADDWASRDAFVESLAAAPTPKAEPAVNYSHVVGTPPNPFAGMTVTEHVLHGVGKGETARWTTYSAPKAEPVTMQDWDRMEQALPKEQDAPVMNERKAFEAAYKKLHPHVIPVAVDGLYASQRSNDAWAVWQARASRAAPGTEQDALRYRWLLSGEKRRQGVSMSGGSRTIERSNLQALMEFQFWCSPNQLNAAIDADIAQGETK
jgi:hypothetical protein